MDATARAEPPVDVLVVGSGFGGAVVAARAAERGYRVLLLERGPWWEAHDRGVPRSDTRRFPRGPGGLLRMLHRVHWARGRRSRDIRLRADGLWEWHAFDDVHAFTANGVGGGSLVYTAIQERPPPAFFSAFPDDLSAEELDPYYANVRTMLRPAPPPHTPRKAAVYERALSRTGLGRAEAPELAIAWGHHPTEPAALRNATGVDQRTCVNVGECVLGCRYRAKTTLDLTYVPLAIRHGAEVRPLCEVVAIGGDRGGYRVTWVDRRSGRRHERVAARLVLAAGALNTVRLLVEARDRWRSLPGLPATLGDGFSTNGDLLALLPPNPDLPGPVTGATINAVHRAPAPGGRSYVIGEAALPVSALPLPGPVRRRLVAAPALFGMGTEAARGRLWWDGRALRARAGRAADPALYGRMEVAAGRIAAGYRDRPRPRTWPAGPGTPLLTVHPLGGARIGRDPRDGVCDHRGQVFGHPGLYVADGSLYPAAPGVPPSMTIAALAERIAALMS